MAASNVFSGSRAIFSLGTNVIGWAGNVSGEETIDHEPVDVLNVLAVAENVPVAYRVSLSAQVFRLVNKSFVDQSIVPSYDSILTSAEVAATIADSVASPNAALYTFTGVRSSGHSFDIAARGLVQEQVNFVAVKLDHGSGVTEVNPPVVKFTDGGG